MANIRSSRRGGRVFRGGRMVRESVWFTGPLVVTTIAAAGTSVLVSSLNAAALALRPFTLVRTRGILQLRSDQEAASESAMFSYGQCVVSDQASAIGITAIPTPATDRSSDLWYVFETLVHRLSVTPAGTGPSYIFSQFDSKAMRKVEDGEDLVVVTEAETASSGGILTQAFRQLIKLH